MFSALKDFWERDGFLSLLLAVLVVGNFIALPFAGSSPGIISQVVFSFVLISGLTVVARAHTLARAAAVFIVATLVMGWIAQFTGHSAGTRTSLVLQLVYLSALTVVVLERVFREGPVTVHRISGAVAAYLLVAMLFANVYSLIELVQPNSFNGAKGVHDWGGFLYFSQLTLFTIGYGDITPVAAGARSLAMLEGLIGQLYPAILLARLVALEIEDRRSRTHS